LIRNDDASSFEPFKNGNDGLTNQAAGIAATTNFYFRTISQGLLHQAKLRGDASVNPPSERL
jgi:hypothetical protein